MHANLPSLPRRGRGRFGQMDTSLSFWIVRLEGLGLVGFGLVAKGLRAGVEAAKGAHEIDLLRAQTAPPLTQRRRVRRLLRPEAAEAAAVVGRANRAA